MSAPQDIVKLTAMLSAAYPNWNITEFTNDIYYEDLKDIPSDLLFIAAKHCRTSVSRDQRFAPSAGEIRLAASEIKRQADGIPSALEAWGELLQAPKSEEVRRETEERDEIGRIIIEIRPYTWRHPLVRKVAVLLGFPKFPDWESESYERAAFLKAYQGELETYLSAIDQPPDVKNYIETSGNKQIENGIQNVAKQLEARNAKK